MHYADQADGGARSHADRSAASWPARAARYAGIAAAAAQTAVSRTATPTSTSGFHADRPNTDAATSLSATGAATTPAATPTVVSFIASPTTSVRMSGVVAPSATRMPISRLRAPVRYAMTP